MVICRASYKDLHPFRVLIEMALAGMSIDNLAILHF